MVMSFKSHLILLLLASLVLFSGCAEGLFWKTGRLSPWVRKQWSEEEQIAATLFTKRSQMKEMAERAATGDASQKEEASQYLAKIVSNDPVLLLRIEATKLLGSLRTETSEKALQLASQDREVPVRIAATRSLGKIGSEASGQLLAQMARNDSDIDVRISATASLGQCSGQHVRDALSEIINDPDPAMQLRAAESLAVVTGQTFGKDIQAWQAYLKRNGTGSSSKSFVADDDRDNTNDFLR